MPPVLIDIKVKGKERVIARFNKIIANLPKEMNLGAKNLAEYGQIEARNVIRQNTKGSGNNTLANSIEVRTLKIGKGQASKTTYEVRVNPDIARYAGYVHDGFEPHWVSVQDKPDLMNWIVKNMGSIGQEVIARNKIFIGGPNSAAWIKSGGLKFMDKAYAKMLGLTDEEYTQRVKRVIRGK